MDLKPNCYQRGKNSGCCNDLECDKKFIKDRGRADFMESKRNRLSPAGILTPGRTETTDNVLSIKGFFEPEIILRQGIT